MGETSTPSGVALRKPPRAGELTKGVYRARRPKDSALWRIFDESYGEFEEVYEERLLYFWAEW